MIAQAFVIKNYFPARQTIAIFHQQFGKIHFFIQHKDQASLLCNGSLIYCDIVKKNTIYQCLYVDPYFVPAGISLEHLYFVHDILKICKNYIPQEIMLPDVFDLIVYIYSQIHHFDNFTKKQYLLRLFLYVGVFPDNPSLYHYVMQEKLFFSQEIDLLFEKSLQYCWNFYQKNNLLV